MQKTRFLLTTAAAVIVTCGVSSVQAATLAGVPMQGMMAMPMVAYQAADGRLHVMMPAEVPQLTPLLVSNPADRFDPADPWYDDLDPSRQGQSFSRRYGFVMDAMSEPLPAGTAIWLRKLAGPTDLGFYRYSGSAPKAWQAIFGTAGATNALFWNGMMFHPGVAGPSGTNPITATFEAFLVNTNTLTEVAGSSSGPLVFDFTNVSDGRPAVTLVSLAQQIVVAWPAGTTNWSLEAAETVPSAHWTPVTNAPVTVEGQTGVVIDQGAGNQFFRMRHLP